jgi:cytochrome c1
MSGSPRVTAELRKLAHALDVDDDQVDMLAGLPVDDLRTLRTQIGEALFQADKHYFVRMAALTRTVPGAVSAKLTEAVVPPLIAARTAELLEPKRAAELVGRISESYLADVSAFMDASRAPEIIAAIPPARVGAVAAELARREEWVVIGGFVAQVTEDAMAASVAEFDGGQLLRIGFVLDDMSRLNDIGGLLSDQQIDELLAAAAEHELWTELEELLDNLGPERLARMADRYAGQHESVRAAYEAAVASGALVPSVLETLAG